MWHAMDRMLDAFDAMPMSIDAFNADSINAFDAYAYVELRIPRRASTIDGIPHKHMHIYI